MFYWTRCRYHGNKAGSKPALNNGFDLFSENLVVRFFSHHLSLENWENNGLLTLVLWNFDREIFCYFVFCILTFSEHVLCQISIFPCKQVKGVPNYYSTIFHEILMRGSIEISAFPLHHAVTVFWLTAHALHLTGFSIFLDPYKESQKGRVFSNSITFITLKNKRFWHKTNCLFVKMEKTLAKSSLNKMKWSLYRHHVCFSQSLVRALIHVSSTNRRHSRPQSCDPFGQRHGSRALAGARITRKHSSYPFL